MRAAKKISPKGDYKKIRRFLALFFSVFVTGLILYYRKTLVGFAGWSYLGIFLLNFLSSATIIFPVPGILSVVAVAAVLQPLPTGLLAGLGSALGEVTGYLSGYGGQLLSSESNKLVKIRQMIKNNGFLFFVFFSFLPNPVFDLAGIVAGLTNYSFIKFLTACLVGRISRYVLLAYFGSALLF